MIALRILFVFSFVFFLFSCEKDEGDIVTNNVTNNNTNGDTTQVDTSYVDTTMIDTTNVDSVITIKRIVSTSTNCMITADSLYTRDSTITADTIFINQVEIKQGDCPEKIINADVVANTTWYKDTIYILNTRVKVRPPATLTIKPGTIIKGGLGQGANITVLMIMRDAKIIADGSPSEPIIFTTVADQIQPGEIASPILPNDFQGKWGGLAILGNGIISSGINSGGGFDVDQIEGVPAADADGKYGGNDDNDDSGVLRFVSVRHGGASLAPGNELNGISFGGVGRGTTVEFVEILGCADDGIEACGGAVNIKNIVVLNNGDDAIDTDQDYKGTIDNGFVICPEGSPFELDGPEGTNSLGRNHTVKNFTVVAVRADGTRAYDLLNFDSNTNVSLENIHYATVAPSQRINTNRANSPVATFSNITLNVSNVATYINSGQSNLNSAVSTGHTSYADASKFLDWSWASLSGSLVGL